jgi:molybdopterin synthase catalytic subunit
MIEIKITSESLNLSSCVEKIMSPQTGGINVFIGTVRDHTKGKKVVRLEFEAYEKMALSEMQKIADEMIRRWPLPVIIAVSASHRDAAFEACRYAIDTLKQTVPIWKKEIFEDGEEWVAAHP